MARTKSTRKSNKTKNTTNKKRLHQSYKRAYNHSYDRAYNEAYDRAYNEAYSKAYDKKLRKVVRTLTRKNRRVKSRSRCSSAIRLPTPHPSQPYHTRRYRVRHNHKRKNQLPKIIIL
jgi:hypothetical protein